MKVRVPDLETVSFEPELAGAVTELSSACKTLGAAVVCCFAVAAVGEEARFLKSFLDKVEEPVLEKERGG